MFSGGGHNLGRIYIYIGGDYLGRCQAVSAPIVSTSGGCYRSGFLRSLQVVGSLPGFCIFSGGGLLAVSGAGFGIMPGGVYLYKRSFKNSLLLAVVGISGRMISDKDYTVLMVCRLISIIH